MSYKNWGIFQLDKLIEIQIDNRGRNPKNYYFKSKYPVIDNYLIKNQKYPNLLEANRYIDQYTFDNFLRGHVKKGDVLITLVGNGIGNLTTCSTSDCAIIQNTLGLRCNAQMVNDFLYYFLLNKQDNIKKFDRGSSQPSIRKTDLLSMEIEVPTIVEQKAITNILCSLDDKIELNQKINRNLEELAQTLYKRWFVDFEFPNEEGLPYQSSGGEMVESELGLIPKGWKVLDLSKLILQKRQKTNPNKLLNLIDMANMPQYSISLAGFDPGDKLKTNLFAMEKMDLLYGSIRPYLGKFGIAPFNGITTGTVHCFSSVKEGDYSFVCGVVFSKAFNDFCNQVSHGTKMPIVKWKDFESFKVAYESNLSTKFNKILIESYKLIVEKVNENINLSKLRDELLPKLMSGEIEVPSGDENGA